MCRLALFNKQWLNMIEEIELQGLFKTLNDKNGGHGIGVAFCYEKSSPVIHKGVSLDPIEIASLVYGEKDNPDLQYIIYHARMASAAMVTDDMCHPFSEEKLFGLTLAHNGHVRQYASSSTYSDTAIIYKLLTDCGLPLHFLEDLSGVFVGIHKKVPFVVKPTSYSELDLAYSPDKSAFCFCSNFYQYTTRFKERFIVETGLDTFTWSHKLTDKAIRQMVDKYRGVKWDNSSKFTTTYNSKPITKVHSYPSDDVSYISGYGYVEKRYKGMASTYHDLNCYDTQCYGECLEVKE